MIYELFLPYQEDNIINIEESIKVGIDKGALIAIDKGIKLDYILGDFDSITSEELKIIKKKCPNIIKLNPIKDDTDTEFAINYFKNATEFIIHGGIQGKRIEHLISNINLILKYDNINVIKDNNTRISRLLSGAYFINEYKYISFFAKSGSIISLKGFKYDLDNYQFKEFDNLCISNEIENEYGEVQFNGKGVIIMSKSDNF